MSKIEENYADAIVIDASTKEPINKDILLELLKSHGVNTAPIEGQDTA